MRLIVGAATMIILAVVLALAIACGGGGGGDEERAAGAEDDLAQSMLLTISEFPVGWAEEPADEEEDNPFDKCQPPDPEGRTGSAETGDFSSGDSRSISQSLSVFETPERARQALDNLVADDTRDCFVQVVDDRELDTEEAEYSSASISDLSFPQMGDGARAFRVEIRAKLKGESGLGSEGDLFVDSVSVIFDRVGFSISASDVFTPYDPNELQDLVTKALNKVTANVGSPASSPSPDAPAETAEPTDPSPSPPPPSPTLPPASSLSVGETGLTGGGNMLTVHSYETGVTAEFFDPEPGNTFVAFDIEGCAKSDLQEPVSLNPFDFELQMPDNTRREADIGIREPTLNDTTLFAGDCVRGWVTFQVPQGVTPQFIIFETFDADFNPVQLKWAVG